MAYVTQIVSINKRPHYFFVAHRVFVVVTAVDKIKRMQGPDMMKPPNKSSFIKPNQNEKKNH